MSGAMALGRCWRGVTFTDGLGGCAVKRRLTTLHGLPAPNGQSAQAEEREHRSNHDDQPDDIDDTVHSSAPQRCQSCRSYKHPGSRKVRRDIPRFSARSRERKPTILLAGPGLRDHFAFARKGR